MNDQTITILEQMSPIVYDRRTHVYLAHDSVCSSTLLIFEEDVRIAVGDELFELAAVSSDAALGQTASSQRVFRHVGRVLLEYERRHFAWTSPKSGTTTWSTRCHSAAQQQSHYSERQHELHLGPPAQSTTTHNTTQYLLRRVTSRPLLDLSLIHI